MGDLLAASGFYLSVLARRRVRISRPGPNEVWRIARRLSGNPFWGSGEAAALLPTDCIPPSDRRIAATFRVVRALRTEHLTRVGLLDSRAYRRRPAPGTRSPRETLAHLANCEWWYCSRLDDRLPEPGAACPRETRARLAYLLDFAERYVRSLPPPFRRRVVVPRRFPSRDRTERWTAGKVLRRLAEHEFEHLRALLGRLPRLGPVEPAR